MGALRHFTTHFYQMKDGRAVPDIQGEPFGKRIVLNNHARSA